MSSVSVSTSWRPKASSQVSTYSGNVRWLSQHRLKSMGIEEVFCTVRDGTDLWIGSNEARDTDRYAYTPIPSVSRRRALMVEYAHTLVWQGVAGGAGV